LLSPLTAIIITCYHGTMAEITAYRYTTSTTATINTDLWHKVSMEGPTGMFTIREWINKHKDGLVGGWQIAGNTLRFQRQEDVMFFKLSTNYGR